MFLVGLIFGSIMTYTVPMTTIHNDCIRGDEQSCIVESKLSVYKHDKE